MNWDRFQTYGLSSEKSFEMLCNQLFENWCKETYKDDLLTFSVVNGAGGDGGVESYAEVKNSGIVGLQAKWFRSSIDSNHISQIRNSLNTAMKIRPNITRYIVCVPRDLASTTGRGENSESKRWDDFLNAVNKKHPSVSIELWNDTRITTEIQKPSAAGINRYWFTNSEIDCNSILFSFNKAKSSWLSTKYVPDLNVPGRINKSLARYIGDFDLRLSLSNRIYEIVDLCKKFEISSNELIIASKSAGPEIVNLLSEPKERIHGLQLEGEKLLCWLVDENKDRPSVEIDRLFISFEKTIRLLRESSISYSYHFHVSEIIKTLNRLSGIDYYDLSSEVQAFLNNQSILFLGNPGTGKTHGVSSFVEKLLNQRYHISLLVQARSIPENYGWKDIIISTIGLSNTWSEDELWQALISAANRSRFQDEFMQRSIKINPKVLIIVDGIDESSSYQKWVDRIKEANVISETYPKIKFCFTSRPVVFSGQIDYANVIRLEEAGDVPAFKIFDAYTNAYGITIKDCRWLKYELNTPLALKLFCELYRGKNLSTFSRSEVSMDQLWREKVRRIQSEYNSKVSASSHNQDVVLAIRAISKCFVENEHVERERLISVIQKDCKNDVERAEKLLDHIEAYGIVGSFCREGSGLLPDCIFYYPGIQGYYDYASARYLLDVYDHPSAINFEECSGTDTNTLYCLALISMQQYQYLITRNPTIDKVSDDDILFELQFYALQNSDIETAKQFKSQSMNIMKSGADSLVTIVNRLVLPLSRISEHPLGVTMLDEFLMGFSTPAYRDMVWSLPAWLQRAKEKTWWKSEDVALLNEDEEEYALTSDDLSDGLPIVYAWMLSNVSNTVRKKCRDELMIWAQTDPHQFFTLFQHFSEVNDPQIRSDLFSILMCLVYDFDDAGFTKEISAWILSNVLAPSVIDQNRDISVRYYSIAIIEKAKISGIFTDEEVEEYLPPYNAENNDIVLDKNALSGTRMGGYSAISYDLARYVLIDHFSLDFNTRDYNQLDKLVIAIASEKPAFAGMTSDQFIISAAYAFLMQMGWNEADFYNYSKDVAGNYIGGADCSIRASYYSATHGQQSDVMTIAEKYVWQARNYISGFLCDRLPFGDNLIWLTDYGMLDDFLIPIQEIHQINPDDIPSDRPWYIPEPQAVMPSEKLNSREAISHYIKTASDIDWSKWIQVDNSSYAYEIPISDLLALKLFSCFYTPFGVETNLFIDSIVLPQNELPQFISALHDKKLFDRICDPTGWDGGIEASCYITPREACWFHWKNHYNSSYTEEFPGLAINPAIERCCYYYPEYNDVYYYMPSTLLRTIWGIVDTDGYRYYDKEKKVVSEYCIAGEKWRTAQHYVLVGKEISLQRLHDLGLTMVWFTQEMRRETGKAKEQFGEFFVEKRQYCVGYFHGRKFVSEILKTDFSENI